MAMMKREREEARKGGIGRGLFAGGIAVAGMGLAAGVARAAEIPKVFVAPQERTVRSNPALADQANAALTLSPDAVGAGVKAALMLKQGSSYRPAFVIGDDVWRVEREVKDAQGRVIDHIVQKVNQISAGAFAKPGRFAIGAGGAAELGRGGPLRWEAKGGAIFNAGRKLDVSALLGTQGSHLGVHYGVEPTKLSAIVGDRAAAVELNKKIGMLMTTFQLGRTWKGEFTGGAGVNFGGWEVYSGYGGKGGAGMPVGTKGGVYLGTRISIPSINAGALARRLWPFRKTVPKTGK